MADLDALKSLHNALIDAVKGYDKAGESADSGEVGTLFGEMRSLHMRAHNDLDALLRSRGQTPDESASFMSVVHTTVIAIRSATTGLNSASLSSFADGEERILTAYDKAIDGNREDQAALNVLARQKSQLAGMVVRMRGASLKSGKIPNA